MNDFDDWIGREREAVETVSERLVREYRVTMDKVLPAGGQGPLPGLHWCLAPEAYAPEYLGRDGHPRVGLFLPDLGLARRMWAGGRLSYKGGLSVGETVTRKTRVKDIQFKTGRSGKLGFLTLEHLYLVQGETRITEDHNIVYRPDPDPDAPAPVPPEAESWEDAEGFEIEPGPTLLFRYSALTFNGHRIHYDLPYATGVEGYEGLVVHGPMQSAWMQCLATDLLGRQPEDFRYRGLSPLICGRKARVEARRSDAGFDLRVRDLTRNVVTMQAQAR